MTWIRLEPFQEVLSLDNEPHHASIHREPCSGIAFIVMIRPPASDSARPVRTFSIQGDSACA